MLASTCVLAPLSSRSLATASGPSSRCLRTSAWRGKRYWIFAPGELVNLLLPGALRRTKPFQPPPPSFLSLTEQGRSASLKRAPRQVEVRRHLLDGPLAVARLRELSGARSEARRVGKG